MATVLSLLLPLLLGAVLGAGSAPPPLRVVADVPLPGPAVRFDYQSLDPVSGRLYIAHMNAGQLVVFDTRARQVVANLDGFARVHGVLSVPDLGRVYASATGDHQVAVVDMKTLKTLARVGPIAYPDGLAHAPAAGRVFVSDEHGRADAVIDVKSNALVTSIALGGEAGNTVYDSGSGHILAAVHDPAELVAIDPATARIVARYPLAGVKEPHGVSLDVRQRLAFVAGQANGTLAVFDLASRKVLATHAVGEGPDVLAFDPGLGRLYVASESGTVSVFREHGRELVPEGEMVMPSAHTVCVDPATHLVYFPLENVGGRPVLRILEPPQVDSTMAVAAAAEGMRLDGVLDEPAWARATPLGPLVQLDPEEGAPASEETEVRVLFDADALYFGVTCHDTKHAGIVSTQLGRDADLEVDDRITVVLDPFFDHRNGFFFAVNPAGARSDGQISNNARELSYEWDGIWDARARVTDEGWVAEIAIPFKSLRFKPGQTVWGFNVERQIKRLQEHDRWASARRDSWIGNLAAAGQLAGLTDLRQGRGLDVRPFVSGGEQDARARFKAGVDVFKSITASLTGSLTVNTDFAETEVDARQINLTRFELFFPEKRAFFLEGAGVYDVAGLGSQEPELVPFFSRTVGLLDGQEVPILFGLKVSGRQAGLNVGFLDVETRRTTLDEGPLAAQDLLAVRLSKNLFEQSWIGGIATRGNPNGAGHNRLVGLDARLATAHFNGGKNLAFNVYGLRTDDEASGRPDYAAGFTLDYPNDLWNVTLGGKRIGERFNPAMGFVPRKGICSANLYTAFQPRPGRSGIRQFFFEIEPSLVASLHGRVENWRVFTAPFNARTESGEHLEWNYIPTFERLDAPFEIQPRVVIPPGSYRWTRFRAEVNTATKRPWVVDFAYRWGSFYDGRLRQYQPALTLKPSIHVALVLQMERDEGTLPAGRFVTQLLSSRIDYSASPNLTWTNLVQYDTVSRILGFQSRFRWILQPGNDLFVVVSRGWFRRLDGEYVPSFDTGSAKLQYTIRL